MMELHIIYSVFVLAAITHSNALRCYTCSYVATGGDGSRACLDDPDNADGTKITNCNKKYCTIQRQELTSPKGYVNSFLRGCEDKPINDVFEDPTFKTYFRSCNTELCNHGDGIRSAGVGGRPDGEHGANMVVPGLPGCAASLRPPAGRSTVIVITVVAMPAIALAVRQLLLL